MRFLGRPALAGSPRDGLGNCPPIVSALASVACQLWDDEKWTGQEEVEGWMDRVNTRDSVLVEKPSRKQKVLGSLSMSKSPWARNL